MRNRNCTCKNLAPEWIHFKDCPDIEFGVKKIDYSGINILQLFLTKLETLTDEERKILIHAIDIMNHPIFIANGSSL